MSEAILRILEVQAVVGGGLILVMLGLRGWLRGKVSNALIYGLWLFVAIRMLLPIELPRPALVPSVPVISIQRADRTAGTNAQAAAGRTNAETERLASLSTGDSADIAPQGQATASPQPHTPSAARPPMGAAQWWILAWLTGAGLLLAYMIWVNGRWRMHVLRTSKRMRIKTRLPVLLADVPSPCLMGVMKPCVVLNADAARPENLPYALAHELSHHRSKDHLWNMLRNVMLVLFWFHPLVWVAAHCSRLDCERACDEQVTRRLGRIASIEYAHTLISLVSVRGIALSASSSFMAANLPEIKRRVAQVVARKRPKRWACVVFAGLLALTTAASFATGEAVAREAPKADQMNSASAAPDEADDPVEDTTSASPTDAGLRTLSLANERVPLPVPPDEMYQYELKFSRPLNDKEQQLWNELWSDLGKNANLFTGDPAKIITYTARAIERIKAGESFPGSSGVQSLGDGAPGTVLLDHGTITVCIGDEKLTRKKALPLVCMVAPAGRYPPEVDSWYNWIYCEYSWVRAFPGRFYSETRGLVRNCMPEPTEGTRHSQLTAEYMLRGLRPQAPIPTSETADGSLWFDEATVTFHLPAQYVMTDEEILQFIDKEIYLERQAVLDKTPDVIGEQQAIEAARQWALKLYEWDVSTMPAFAYLQEECEDGGCPEQAMWRIWFAPEDWLIGGIVDYDYCEIIVYAQTGGLHFAARNTERGVQPPSDKTTKQIKAELEPIVTEKLRALLADGTNTGKVDFCRSDQYGFAEPLPDNAKEIPQEILCYLDAPDGGKYHLQYASGSLALESFHYESKDYDDGNW